MQYCECNIRMQYCECNIRMQYCECNIVMQYCECNIRMQYCECNIRMQYCECNIRMQYCECNIVPRYECNIVWVCSQKNAILWMQYCVSMFRDKNAILCEYVHNTPARIYMYILNPVVLRTYSPNIASAGEQAHVAIFQRIHCCKYQIKASLVRLRALFSIYAHTGLFCQNTRGSLVRKNQSLVWK